MAVSILFICELDFFLTAEGAEGAEKEKREIEIIGFFLTLQSAQADFACVDAVSTADSSLILFFSSLPYS